MPADNPDRLLVKFPLPVPTVVLLLLKVGFIAVDQHKPQVLKFPSPKSITLTEITAEFVDTDVTSPIKTFISLSRFIQDVKTTRQNKMTCRKNNLEKLFFILIKFFNSIFQRSGSLLFKYKNKITSFISDILDYTILWYYLTIIYYSHSKLAE